MPAAPVMANTGQPPPITPLSLPPSHVDVRVLVLFDLLFLAAPGRGGNLHQHRCSRLSAVGGWPMARATLFSGYDASSGCEDSTETV
jgi:hypothetical protein